MILLRRGPEESTEEMELEEFEERIRAGQINPSFEVCFPVITGDRFVQAKDLELFKGLYRTDLLNFKRYFHLGRVPWLTMGVIALLCFIHLSVVPPTTGGSGGLLQRGAKSLPLMVELGEWWRLITSNLIHVSGWHLAVNCLFLFNLGGPAEAMFRRLDYTLVMVASGLGGMALSALVNPAVSCGASGVVFGVWGAVATFGVRYRNLLPERYRRYFIRSVIPYSIFALYMGIAMPGIDNWGHLGGLVTGCATALFLPARMLHPHDSWSSGKVLLLASLSLLLALGSALPQGPGELVSDHYFPRNGLMVPVPRSWHDMLARRDRTTETYAYDNEAGVVIGFETRETKRPGQLDHFATEFLELDLSDQLELNDAKGLRIQEPEDAVVAGYPAKRIEAEIITPKTASHITYYLMTRGNYRYILSLSAPIWLASAYEGIFGAIINRIQIVAPDRLVTALRNSEEEAGPHHSAELGIAQAYANLVSQADSTLDYAMQEWPESGEPFAAKAQLLYEAREDLHRACILVRYAMEHQEWTSKLLMLAVNLHERCEEKETAERILRAAIKRFPQDRTLKNRARSMKLPDLEELLKEARKASSP
jgi:rhomboid protease GluP